MTTSDDKQHLLNFYSVLEERLKSYREAKQRLDRFLSTDFNVFKWFFEWTKWKEDFLSDIIADMLNPAGSHGQDRIFLDAFLEIIKWPDLKDKKYPKVATQVPTRLGKFDILVEFEKFGIVIENKLEAAEQPRQLQRYLDYLKEEYGDQGFCLIYLTPNKRNPISIEEDTKKLLREKKLICISYSRDMLKWVEECCQLCESDKFRWFLRDFMDYIPTMLQEVPMGDSIERNTIFNHALENKKNLGIALDINTAFNGLELHRRIIVQFLDKLEKFVLGKLSQRSDGSEWEVNYDSLRNSPLEKERTFGFGKQSWRHRYTVAIEPQTKNAGDVIIGVSRKQKDALRADQEAHIWTSLEHMFKTIDEGPTEWWAWRGLLQEPYMNWNSKKTLIKLYNGEAVKDLSQYLVNIIDVVERTIDEHVGKS